MLPSGKVQDFLIGKLRKYWKLNIKYKSIILLEEKIIYLLQGQLNSPYFIVQHCIYHTEDFSVFLSKAYNLVYLIINKNHSDMCQELSFSFFPLEN